MVKLLRLLSKKKSSEKKKKKDEKEDDNTAQRNSWSTLGTEEIEDYASELLETSHFFNSFSPKLKSSSSSRKLDQNKNKKSSSMNVTFLEGDNPVSEVHETLGLDDYTRTERHSSW